MALLPHIPLLVGFSIYDGRIDIIFFSLRAGLSYHIENTATQSDLAEMA
jgi:hypothetical protein